MTVIKNQKSNTYEVRTYYKDWTGVRKQKTKRGFKRKCDAQEWERAFKLKENLSLDMYFEDFVDLYLNDIKSRIKYNTYSAVAIGERVGHESVEITYRYAHLFPTIQTEMAENLNQEREEYLDE